MVHRKVARPIRVVLLGMLVVLGSSVWGPAADLVLRNGRVIDPRNGVDGVMDIALVDGRIARVGPALTPSADAQVVDVSGLIVTPGLIDLHVHVFYGTQEDSAYSDGFSAVQVDAFAARSGVTTAVDAGGSGWRDFVRFKRQVIDRSVTRVLSFINIVGAGMKGGPIEQDLADMDPKLTAQRARQFPESVVGVKIAHYEGPDWTPVDRAVEAGRQAGVPVMVDFGRSTPALPLGELLLDHLRPGDILTHAYANVTQREAIVDTDGRLQDFARKARERGVIFDVGHGAGSFLLSQATPAMEQGFAPDTISTDLHRSSMNAGMKDMLNVMSKLLNLGMPLEEVVSAATASAARAIQRDDLGHLGPGSAADIAVLRVRDGDFGFVDSAGYRMSGARKLECELTLRAGEVVWDLNGLSRPDWDGKPVEQ